MCKSFQKSLKVQRCCNSLGAKWCFLFSDFLSKKGMDPQESVLEAQLLRLSQTLQD